MINNNLWERQEYETDTAFDRFHKYYLAQDPPRSVEEAYRRWKHKSGRNRAGKTPGSWTAWAWPKGENVKSWPERAAAWDDHLASLRQAEWEARHMSVPEALARLSDMARSDLADFNDVVSSGDLKKAEQSQLIKKLKITKRLTRNGDVVTNTEIELYDAQAATRDILKIHGKFVDKVEHSGSIENKMVIIPPKQ